MERVGAQRLTAAGADLFRPVVDPAASGADLVLVFDVVLSLFRSPFGAGPLLPESRKLPADPDRVEPHGGGQPGQGLYPIRWVVLLRSGHGQSGSVVALPIWIECMKEILRDMPVEQFPSVEWTDPFSDVAPGEAPLRRKRLFVEDLPSPPPPAIEEVSPEQ